jgi:hypothetical protein
MYKTILGLMVLFCFSSSFAEELGEHTRSKIMTNIYHRNYEDAKENNTANSELETLIAKYSQAYWAIYDEAMKHADHREVKMGDTYYGITEFVPDQKKEHEGVLSFRVKGKKHTVSTTKKSVKMVLNAIVEGGIDTSLAGNYLMIGVHNLFDKSGDREYGVYILENTPHEQAQMILDYYKEHNSKK